MADAGQDLRGCPPRIGPAVPSGGDASDRTDARSLRGSWITRLSAASAIAARLVLVTALVTVGGCGSAPSPTPAPTAVATPTPTPDPHLADPTTASRVYAALTAAGLRVIGNSADAAVGGKEPRRRINATLGGWPLVIAEYSTSAALAVATKPGPSATKPGPAATPPAEAPSAGTPPYVFEGMNIRIEFGPRAGGTDSSGSTGPTGTAATELAAALDAVIGPLRQSGAATVPLPTLGAPTP